MIEVRGKQIGLPLGGGNIMWTRADQIAHIKPYGDKCDVVFRTPYKAVERSDGSMVLHAELTVYATAEVVLSACEKAEES